MRNDGRAPSLPRDSRSIGRSDRRSGADLRGVTIRAARADDTDRLAKAFRALDPASIYQRFFFPKRELSDEELRRLTECDGVREVVLVATVASADQEIIVGLGRYARNGESPQIAFIVADDYQGRGIASQLLVQLAGIACRNGFLQLEADVLPRNAPMLKVFRSSGLCMREKEAEGIVHVTLLLGDGCESAGVARSCLDRIAHPDRTATFQLPLRNSMRLPFNDWPH